MPGTFEPGPLAGSTVTKIVKLPETGIPLVKLKGKANKKL